MTEYSHTLKTIQVTEKKWTYYEGITNMWCWLTA